MVFRRKKQRDWQPESIPEVEGRHADVHVLLRNVPCLRDPHSDERAYAYANFGADFRRALDEAIAGERAVVERMNDGSPLRAAIRLPSRDTIDVEIRTRDVKNISQFDSDLSDAIIAAFRSARLAP